MSLLADQRLPRVITSTEVGFVWPKLYHILFIKICSITKLRNTLNTEDPSILCIAHGRTYHWWIWLHVSTVLVSSVSWVQLFFSSRFSCIFDSGTADEKLPLDKRVLHTETCNISDWSYLFANSFPEAESLHLLQYFFINHEASIL